MRLFQIITSDTMNAIPVAPKNIHGVVLYFESRYLPMIRAKTMGTTTAADTLVNMSTPGFHHGVLLSVVSIKRKRPKPSTL